MIRKSKYNKDKNDIIKKYKYIKDKENAKFKNKIFKLVKTYKENLQELSFKYEKSYNLKTITGIIYNTYKCFNNNYYNAINIRNILLDCSSEKNKNNNKMNDNKNFIENYMDQITDNKTYNNNQINKNKNLNDELVVFYYKCHLCNTYPIILIIYYCKDCKMYICEDCMKKNNCLHRHPLLKIKSQNQLNEIKEEKQEEIMNGNNFIYDMAKTVGDFVNYIRSNNNYSENLSKLKKKYDVDGISEEKLIQAIKEANGNIDEAILLLLK